MNNVSTETAAEGKELIVTNYTMQSAKPEQYTLALERRSAYRSKT